MKNKLTKNKDVIKAIIKNYKEAEKSLVAQLNFKVPNHSPTIGGYREEIWKQLFEQIVPKKYVIEQSVFLIDSDGNVSDEVDLAIFDEMYTPYIFRKGRIKFIPVEAVAAVVQCKSTNVVTKDLIYWYNSIHKLKTSRRSVARMYNCIATNKLHNNTNGESTKITQSGTRPIFILCCLEEPSEDITKKYDFIICAKKPINKKCRISVGINKNYGKLSEWFVSLNHCEGIETVSEKFKNKWEDLDDDNNKTLDDYKVYDDKGEEIPLLTLNFQLNQLLMLINNPMLFPHMAYVNMFNNIDKKGKDDGKDTD